MPSVEVVVVVTTLARLSPRREPMIGITGCVSRRSAERECRSKTNDVICQNRVSSIAIFIVGIFFLVIQRIIKYFLALLFALAAPQLKKTSHFISYVITTLQPMLYRLNSDYRRCAFYRNAFFRFAKSGLSRPDGFKNRFPTTPVKGR